MFFQKKDKKEKIIISDDDFLRESKTVDEPLTNPYYAMVSYRYKLAKYAAVIILVFFVLISISLNSENITYNNFVFLIKDMNTVFEAEGVLNVQKNVRYNPDKNQAFALYRNGLAIAGSSNIFIYNSAGKQTYSGDLQYMSPHISSSEKYFLVYDQGAKSYSIYNSFAKVYEKKNDNVLVKAKICDQGVYATVSQDQKYASVLTLYNKDFGEIQKHYKEKYITDFDISDNGENVIIASAGMQNGEFYTDISTTVVGSGEETTIATERGAFPMMVGYNDSGSVVCCDEITLFFDKEGGVLKRFDYGYEKLSFASVGNKHFALILSNFDSENDHKLLVFDNEGNSLLETAITGRIDGFELYDENVYILFDKEIKRFSADGEEHAVSISPGAKDMLVINKNTVLLCYANHTAYIEIN